MTRREFAARLAERGPDIGAWPQADAARALLMRSAACRRLYLVALEADASLAEMGAADGDRLSRLQDQLADTKQRRPVPAALPGMALAACGLIGLLVGWYTTEAPRPIPLVYAAVDLTPFTGSGE